MNLTEERLESEGSPIGSDEVYTTEGVTSGQLRGHSNMLPYCVAKFPHNKPRENFLRPYSYFLIHSFIWWIWVW